MVRITKNIFIVFFISMNILFFSCSTSNNSKLSENIIPTENIEIHTNNNLKINNEGNNSKPVLIDFYSDTWLTCKASLPGITTLKSRVGNHAKFITYDVKNPDSIPMLKKYNASKRFSKQVEIIKLLKDQLYFQLFHENGNKNVNEDSN